MEKKARVGRIILNRPEVLNATNHEMGEELNEALNDMAKDEQTRCLLITGAGKAFCAGEDIPSFKARYGGSLTELLQRKYHPMILRIRRMEKPVIARLNGIAAGGGASIALAAISE